MVSHQGVLIQDISSPREITARSMYLPYFSGLRQSEHHLETLLVYFEGLVDVPIVMSHCCSEPVANQFYHVNEVHPVHSVIEMFRVMPICSVMMFKCLFQTVQEIVVLGRAICTTFELRGELVEELLFWGNQLWIVMVVSPFLNSIGDFVHQHSNEVAMLVCIWGWIVWFHFFNFLFLPPLQLRLYSNIC